MTQNWHNTNLLVVDGLTKATHFIPRNLIDGALEIDHKFIKEIFRLHWVLQKIISVGMLG